MGGFRKGVGLIHELAELTGSEEFFNNGGNRLRIDQVVGHQGIDFLQAHPFFNSTLHTNQSDTILVLKKFTDGTYPSIPEMIDVINSPLGIFKFYKGF